MHPDITIVWADSAYAGKLVEWAKRRLNLTIKPVSRPKDASGFVILPHRCVVERGLAWMMHARYHGRDYERLVQHSEPLITWAAISLMTRRLARKSATPSRPRKPVRPAPDRPLLLLFLRVADGDATSWMLCTISMTDASALPRACRTPAGSSSRRAPHVRRFRPGEQARAFDPDGRDLEDAPRLPLGGDGGQVEDIGRIGGPLVERRLRGIERGAGNAVTGASTARLVLHTAHGRDAVPVPQARHQGCPVSFDLACARCSDLGGYKSM